MRKLIDAIAARLGYVPQRHFDKAHELLDASHRRFERVMDRRFDPESWRFDALALHERAVVITTDYDRNELCS